MSKLDNIESTIINAPADKAWEIIGPDFLLIANWARGIHKSWEIQDDPVKFDGAPAGGRHCDLGKLGITDEHILHYDAKKKEITWSASSNKLPGFLKGLQNALKVEYVTDNKSRISSHMTANMTGIGGLLFGAKVQKSFANLMQGFLKDWKSKAETGDISDAKKRELNR